MRKKFQMNAPYIKVWLFAHGCVCLAMEWDVSHVGESFELKSETRVRPANHSSGEADKQTRDKDNEREWEKRTYVGWKRITRLPSSR